jgi:LmbE family N-acetylglucosaminyl deacetylase
MLLGLRRNALRAVATLSGQGVRALYHLMREREALRLNRRRDMQPHLVARLNLAAARRGNPLGAVLKTAGCDDVRSLTPAALERRAELTAALRSLPLQDAIDLYTYFRYFDDFRTSSFLRTEVLQAYLRAQENAADVLPDALVAALELGRPDAVLQLVRSKRTRSEDHSEVALAEATAHALRGEAEAAERIWRRAFQPEDLAFGAFVRGRTVAVVGPASKVEEIRDEIDSFDVIVRTNYQGGVDPSYGGRTDVSYYNGNRLRSRRDEIIAAASEVPWLVTARGSDDALRRMFPRHAGLRSAERAAPSFACGGAGPLAIPIMLADLIRFRPARIKIFCVDFFRSQAAYRQGYHRRPISSDAIAHSLRVHDPFSSFRFVQELYRAGLCEADRIAGEVLRLSLDAYAADMQVLYGHHAVENENPQ